MRQFQVLETCIWEKSSSSEPLIGYHPLGTIFWGMKEDNHDGYVCALNTMGVKRSYAEQILSIVAAEHNISIEESLECPF